jgi:2-haloacid dehalogenase
MEHSMSIDRRTFLAAAAAAAAAAATAGAANITVAASPKPLARAKAIAFDAFPIIDARPIESRAEELLPGHGARLLSAWRTRQFEYTWLRTLAGRYVDFWQTTQDALVFAAGSLGLTLSADGRNELMHAYLQLKAWPDVLPALERFRAAGLRLAFLSNFTAAMLDAALDNAGLRGFFETHMSADRVRAFKPDPRAYAMALNDFGVGRDEIVFCAAAGWDAVGAKWFGYRTFWMNRSQQPMEELGVRVDGAGAGMAELSAFVLGRT